MTEEVRKTKEEINSKYKQINEFFSNPYQLADALEKDEAKKSILKGAWAWDVVIKYFPLANRFNWKQYWLIVKKAVKLCQERNVNIGIVAMYGPKLSKRDEEWLKNGFWWRVQKFPKVGRISKQDAKMLQQHRYNVMDGISKGGINVLKSVGYKDEHAKQIFFNGLTKKLEVGNLLPNPKGKQLRLEKK